MLQHVFISPLAKPRYRLLHWNNPVPLQPAKAFFPHQHPSFMPFGIPAMAGWALGSRGHTGWVGAGHPEPFQVTAFFFMPRKAFLGSCPSHSASLLPLNISPFL